MGEGFYRGQTGRATQRFVTNFAPKRREPKEWEVPHKSVTSETPSTIKTAAWAIYRKNDFVRSKAKVNHPEKQMNPRNAKNTKSDENKHKQQKKKFSPQRGNTDSEDE